MKRGGTIQGKLVIKAGGNSVLLELLADDGSSLFSVDDSGNLTIAGAEVVGGEIAADVTVLTNKKIQFRDSGIYIQSSADGQLDIVADGLLTLPKIAALLFSPTARTATADGTGTGTIAAGSGFIEVTSASADHIIVLPAPVVGTVVLLHVGANGCELRSSAPGTVAINGGAEADAESAIPAGAFVLAVCVSTTAWLALQIASDGTTAGVQAAAAS